MSRNCTYIYPQKKDPNAILFYFFWLLTSFNRAFGRFQVIGTSFSLCACAACATRKPHKNCITEILTWVELGIAATESFQLETLDSFCTLYIYIYRNLWFQEASFPSLSLSLKQKNVGSGRKNCKLYMSWNLDRGTTFRPDVIDKSCNILP
jgi:hypothetical protein